MNKGLAGAAHADRSIHGSALNTQVFIGAASPAEGADLIIWAGCGYRVDLVVRPLLKDLKTVAEHLPVAAKLNFVLRLQTLLSHKLPSSSENTPA